MKRSNWIFIGIGVLVVGVVGYLIYKKRKTTKTDLNDGIKSPTNNTVQQQNTKPTQSANSSVDKNSRAVLITNKKVSQLRDLISNYEYKNNSVYDRQTKGKISDTASWTVWGSLFRTYQSLVSGIQSDATANADTKKYALTLADQYKSLLGTVFPPQIYNTNSKLYAQYKLDTIKPVDVYNEKLTA